MKQKIAGLVVLASLLTATSVFAQVPIKKFKVNGNCESCEKRIEQTALSTEGVSYANWNKRTKTFVVSFDESKTDVRKISKAIADIGYDTELDKASDEAYNKLPGCCRYDRNLVSLPDMQFKVSAGQAGKNG